MRQSTLSLVAMTIVEHRTERTWRDYRVYREPEGGEYADVLHSGIDLAAAVAVLQAEARRTGEMVGTVDFSELVHHEAGWTDGLPRIAPRRPALRLVEGAKGDAA